MLTDEMKTILTKLQASLEEDRQFEAASAIESALLELEAADGMTSRFDEYNEKLGEQEQKLARWKALRSGELEDHLRVIDVQTREVLFANELDQALDKALEAVAGDDDAEQPASTLLGAL